MTHTVETLLALAYKIRDARTYEWDVSDVVEAGNALRAALTEALAQPYVSLINEGNKAQPIIEPEFTGLPKRKLDDLLAQGYKINGVSFQREQDGATWSRGFITYGGMVGWWHGENEQTQPVQVPLTDDDISDIWDSWLINITDKISAIQFAREIEREHHIGGDK